MNLYISEIIIITIIIIIIIILRRVTEMWTSSDLIFHKLL
jgi:hypothetical protein